MSYYARWPAYLGWILIGGFFAIAVGCPEVFALTPKERTLVLHAKSELEGAIAHGVALEAELLQANLHSAAAGSAAITASASVAVAATKIKTAEDQVKKEHEELKRCATENAEMRILVEKVTGPWWFPGGKALLYGLQKSLISLFVIIAALIVIVVGLKLFVPAAAPALAFVGRLGPRVLSLFKRK